MKTQNLLKLIIGMVFITILLPIASCDSANNPSILVGRWVEEYGNIMELLSDGTGIFTDYGEKGVAITWKTENGRFYTTGSGGAQAFGYKMQDSTLIFTEDNGEILKYKKCYENCQEMARKAHETLFDEIDPEVIENFEPF
ncbi:hypothetical protein R83H12_00531 [Fibrobacteria bacterium R8-3-H12]